MNRNFASAAGAGTSSAPVDRQIEARLQGVAAALRRQLDEAHRKKELAMERLRLTRQEVDAADRSKAAVQAKLDSLAKQAGPKIEQELDQLQKEVDKLKHDVSILVDV